MYLPRLTISDSPNIWLQPPVDPSQPNKKKRPIGPRAHLETTRPTAANNFGRNTTLQQQHHHVHSSPSLVQQQRRKNNEWVLDAEESRREYLESIRTFGYTYLKPPGITKTMQQELDDEREEIRASEQLDDTETIPGENTFGGEILVDDINTGEDNSTDNAADSAVEEQEVDLDAEILSEQNSLYDDSDEEEEEEEEEEEDGDYGNLEEELANDHGEFMPEEEEYEEDVEDSGEDDESPNTSGSTSERNGSVRMANTDNDNPEVSGYLTTPQQERINSSINMSINSSFNISTNNILPTLPQTTPRSRRFVQMPSTPFDLRGTASPSVFGHSRNRIHDSIDEEDDYEMEIDSD